VNRLLIAALVVTASVAFAAPSLAASASNAGGTQGCVNQWLDDGIWKFMVAAVEPLTGSSMASDYGWGVNVQARNATSHDDLMMNSTGYHSLVLWFADGTALDITATTVGTIDAQKLTLHTFPQGSLYKHQLLFWYPAGTKQSDVSKPVKLVLKIDPVAQLKRTGQPQYNAKDPSFTVKLDCSK
jgi:hypothetical protein